MVDLHLIGHSNEVHRHEVIVEHNMEHKSRKKAEVEITLLSSAFPSGIPAIR